MKCIAAGSTDDAPSAAEQGKEEIEEVASAPTSEVVIVEEPGEKEEEEDIPEGIMSFGNADFITFLKYTFCCLFLVFNN